MNNNQRKIILIRANLFRSTKIIGRMNPFVKLITKNKEYKSSINKGGEKQPIWNSTELIEVQDGENIKLLIMDFNSRSNPELIAETTLSSHELNGYYGKKDVHFQNQLVGQIELQIQKKTEINPEYLGNFKQVQNILQNNQTNQETHLGPQYQYP
ncbi:unnamed protein product [Paramecium sonneborni]|uniref:C2 domain-containing protein n=1 Tax=Paramecium sonneborni TaxID=65129 RepID=A0A8S1JZ20_9CILI|nr:unnamed protein product [Paramecium sonneborni]